MKILIWHIHGGWMDSFLRGSHEYLVISEHDIPQSRFYKNVRHVKPQDLHSEPVDMIILQRMEEIVLAEEYLGRIPGRDIPAIFVEHNTPKTKPFAAVHPLSSRNDIPIAHVTHFNHLTWDNGKALTRVIEHGIPDPGHLYSGELAHIGVVINEPVRRWASTGTDLLPAFTEVATLDCFGIDTELLPRHLKQEETQINPLGDMSTEKLHQELAKRRMYLHPNRWTSLGLSLLEAMYVGMPVIVLAATEAPRAVPAEAGAISTRVEDLKSTAKLFIHDKEAAHAAGNAAREFVSTHYHLDRFLADWNQLLEDVQNDFSSQNFLKTSTHVF